jgi:hypothetical protein
MDDKVKHLSAAIKEVTGMECSTKSEKHMAIRKVTFGPGFDHLVGVE